MSGFLSGFMFTLVTLLALFLAPQSLLEMLSQRTFVTHVPSIHNDTASLAVVITGASSGIGKGAAVMLVNNGYHVFATVRKPADRDALLQSVDAAERMAPVVIGDLTRPEDVQNLGETVHVWLSTNPSRKLVGLVNNAGTPGDMVMLDKIPIEDSLQTVWDLNVVAQLRLVQTLLPYLRESKGRIINIGSLSGQISRPFRDAYTISKFAMEALSDTLRQELWHDEISVSLVNPGYINTGLGQKSDAATRAKFGEPAFRTDLNPLQRQLLTAFRSKILANLQDAPLPSESTSPIIWHALTSPTPRTRYYPGTVGIGPLPAWVAVKIKAFLPDRVLDRLLVKITAS